MLAVLNSVPLEELDTLACVGSRAHQEGRSFLTPKGQVLKASSPIVRLYCERGRNRENLFRFGLAFTKPNDLCRVLLDTMLDGQGHPSLACRWTLLGQHAPIPEVPCDVADPIKLFLILLYRDCGRAVSRPLRDCSSWFGVFLPSPMPSAGPPRRPQDLALGSVRIVVPLAVVGELGVRGLLGQTESADPTGSAAFWVRVFADVAVTVHRA